MNTSVACLIKSLRFWLLTMVGLIVSVRSDAGVTLEVRIYRFSENGYVFTRHW